MQRRYVFSHHGRARFLSGRPSQRSGLSRTSGARERSGAARAERRGERAGSPPGLGHVDGIRHGRAQAAAGDLERVARAHLVDRQVRRSAATPWLAVTDSVPPSVAPVGLLANATLTVLRGRHHVAVRVLDRRCRPKAAAQLDGGRRLLRDHELRGRGGGHGDGIVTPWPKPLADDRERVAGRGLVERQSGERGHAAGRGHGQRAAERWPAGLFASATVTVPLKEVMRLPELSSASTVRPKALPAVTLAGGCWVTTSCDVARVATRSRWPLHRRTRGCRRGRRDFPW